MELMGIDLTQLELSRAGDWPKPIRMAMLMSALLGTCALGYFFVLVDQINENDLIAQKIQFNKKSFSESQFKATNLEDYKKEVKMVRSQLEQLSEQLPQKNELADFLDDASQQATNSSLKFISIQPQQEVNHGFYRETDVALKMTGHYHAFGEFASNIANMRRIVTVHDFEIKKSDSTSGDAQDKNYLSIELLSKTYWAGGGLDH